jgi:hypothetical protein
VKLAQPIVRAICSWCQAEGSPADLGEREPLDDLAETHGVCQRHLTQFLGSARSRPSAGLRLLIVVKSEERSLYDYLTRAMTEVEGVHVLMDRRLTDRRRLARAISGERRQGDRRQSHGVADFMGCAFVRFGPVSGAAQAS